MKAGQQMLDYEELHNLYYEKIRRYLCKIIGQQDAEDVAQEVFVKANRKLSTLKDPARVVPWLYRIAMNSARDLLRRRSSRGGKTRAETEADALGQLPDPRMRTPEQSVQYNEMIACYLDFVRKLPGHYYEVYVLSELYGLEDRAIAAQVRLPLETVKMRLHRARMKLYETLRSHCRCYITEQGDMLGTLK